MKEAAGKSGAGVLTLKGAEVRLVDRLMSIGGYRSRRQAIQAALMESLGRNGKRMTAEDVLKIAAKGREEYRRGRTRRIETLAGL
jgi:hypothetical protein